MDKTPDDCCPEKEIQQLTRYCYTLQQDLNRVQKELREVKSKNEMYKKALTALLDLDDGGDPFWKP